MKLNYSFMLEEFISSRGLRLDDLNILYPQVKLVHEKITKRVYPELAFLDLPFQDTREIEELGRWIKDRAKYFILLGIGGSALGPRVILDSLKESDTPYIFIYDNIDPRTLKRILKPIELKDVVINVISKSGTTAETAVAFMTIWETLTKAGLPQAQHMVITTDPEKGPLRKIATQYNLKSLSIPPGVVGRYSVLSPVGLLPASVMGVPIEELLEGARDIHRKCTVFDIYKNPAYLFGSLLYLMDVKFSRKNTVLMPYADSLKSLSEWFCQLWAESLGKNGKGLMPYPSVGATDQHSQLQLWIEGPDDKVTIFIRVENYGLDIEILEVFNDVKEFSFFGGHTFSELIKAEQEATALSLMKAGRPSMTISIPEINAFVLGQLFHFFEIATAFTGILYDINPFNQPAVEEGKRFAQAMMGKPGLENLQEEVLKVRQRARYIL